MLALCILCQEISFEILVKFGYLKNNVTFTSQLVYRSAYLFQDTSVKI